MDFKFRIAVLKQKNLHRSLSGTEFLAGKKILRNGRKLVDFGSNDYLGLRRHPAVAAAAAEALRRGGTGGGASRLITGNHPLYEKLEKRISGFKGYPAALIFASGYLANATAIPALAGEGDAVILDRLAHASLVDGARLSKARLLVYAHADPGSLENALRRARNFKSRLVVTESVFSMDGDTAPLREIADLARKHHARLYVDEAHATGVLGPKGRGIVHQLDLQDRVDFLMGTFSKALGSLGGYIAASEAAREFLLNTARGLIFTTALPPSVLAASLKALELAPGLDDRRRRLLRHQKRVRRALREKGFETGAGDSQIIPVLLGREEKALHAHQKLLKSGFFVPAIRFPTVKKGRARLRISLSSEHSESDVEGLLAGFR